MQPLSVQVLMTIRYLASGGSLRNTGDLHGVAKATTGQIINKVTQFLVSLSGEHIKFPVTRYVSEILIYNIENI